MKISEILQSYRQKEAERTHTEATTSQLDKKARNDAVESLEKWANETLLPVLRRAEGDIQAAGYFAEVRTKSGKAAWRSKEYAGFDNRLASVRLSAETSKPEHSYDESPSLDWHWYPEVVQVHYTQKIRGVSTSALIADPASNLSVAKLEALVEDFVRATFRSGPKEG